MPRRSIGFHNVRQPEQLEARTMLAGNGFMPFAFMVQRLGDSGGPREAATQFVSSAIAGQTNGGALGLGAQHPHSHSESSETSLTATLTDSEGSATGTATYSTQTVDGEVETTFTVSVTGATAATTYDVTVGDTVVGQLTTDDTGAGSLALSSNPTGTEQELPADFPTDIGADTAISVGTLSGTFVPDTETGEGGGDGHGGGCHRNDSDGVTTSLEASLTDSDTTSTATGTASYQVDSETGETTFTVSVTGATASSTLDVFVDDISIGQLTTDETGAGSVTFSSDPTDTEQALPIDFPTSISAGSTVTVGTLAGTFATSTSDTGDTSDALYFEMHHIGRRR